MAFCTNCGEPLNEGASFCTGCGAKVLAHKARAQANRAIISHQSNSQMMRAYMA